MVGDNFGISFAGVALVAYMSSPPFDTPPRYAALESTLRLLGKDLKDFPRCGRKAERLARLNHRLRHFFIVCGTDRCACGSSVRGIGLLAEGGKQTAPAAA